MINQQLDRYSFFDKSVNILSWPDFPQQKDGIYVSLLFY